MQLNSSILFWGISLINDKKNNLAKGDLLSDKKTNFVNFLDKKSKYKLVTQIDIKY